MFVHCGSQKYHEPKIYDFDMSILEDPMAPVIILHCWQVLKTW